MINKLLRIVAKFALGSKLLGGVNRANKLLTGVRSELLLGLYALLYVLKHFGLIGAEAEPVMLAILGALAPTLAEKVKNATATADEIIPKPDKPA